MSKSTPELAKYLLLGVLVIGVLMGVYMLLFTGVEDSSFTVSTTPAVPAKTALPAQNASLPPPATSDTTNSTISSPESLAKPAAFDPAQALAEAIRETDPNIRRTRIMTVLRNWAALDPDAAARAAMTWPGSDRLDPIMAVLSGVAGRSDEALRLGTFFCREDPAWAPEHGRSLIDALALEGHYSAAVSFALVGGAEVDGEERNKWLASAFGAWAQHEPQLAALAAANDLPENGQQQEALIAVVSRWRRLNPQGPEKFLAQLPAGHERTALANALAATSGH